VPKKDEQTPVTEEELLTPVGPGARQSSHTDDEDEPVREAADEAEEGPEDEESERVGHADEEVEAEHHRSSRREQRKARKERVKRAKVELEFLRKRNEQLERRFSETDARLSQTEIAALDGQIRDLENQIRQAEEVHTEALSKGSASDATEALRLRDQFRDGLRNLQATRNQAVQSARQRAQPAAPEIDPAIRQRATAWVDENSDWFDPNLSDEASSIAYAVEQRLYREGRLDPRSDAYYAELDRRLKKRLPEVFSDDDEPEERRAVDDESSSNTRKRNGSDRRPSGPTFRTGGRERALRKGEVYVDADRRQAMEDMGVWEDPVLRERYLKSYQKYDREHGRRR